MITHKTCHKNISLIGLKKSHYRGRVKINRKTLVTDDDLSLISYVKAMGTYIT